MGKTRQDRAKSNDHKMCSSAKANNTVTYFKYSLGGYNFVAERGGMEVTDSPFIISISICTTVSIEMDKTRQDRA